MGSAQDRPRRAGTQDRATPGEVVFTGARERPLRSRRGGLQPLVWALAVGAVLLGVGLASAAAPWNPDIAQRGQGRGVDADVGGIGAAPDTASAGGRADGGARLSRVHALPPLAFRGGGRAAAVLSVGSAARRRRISPSFIGWSLEFRAVPAYAGTDPADVNPLLRRLITRLAAGGRPVLRIGGDSTDWTWWPVPGMRRPPGTSFDLTPAWMQMTRALVESVDGRAVLGINLKLDQPRIAAVEATQLLAGVGRQNVAALEIGNEPSNYSTQPWYKNAAGEHIYARSRHYNFRTFAREFAAVARALPRYLLYGPAVGGYHWMAHLQEFLRQEPRVRTVTMHRYPLNGCLQRPRSPQFATIPKLLAPWATAGMTQPLAKYTAAAHRAGRGFTIDELNSVACGGRYGISDTLASALWAPDALFTLFRDGVDAVNIHTFPSAQYAPFVFSHSSEGWATEVLPLYYGLELFHLAAPPGSRLLPRIGRGSSTLRAWAVRTPKREIRVLLINYAPQGSRMITLRLPARGTASLIRLRGRGLGARQGLTLGGQAFDNQGELAGTPRVWQVQPGSKGYSVELPGASAALLTVRAADAAR